MGKILLAGMLLTTSHFLAHAEVETTSTYITSQGIVSDLGPQGFLIQAEGQAPPVHYT